MDDRILINNETYMVLSTADIDNSKYIYVAKIEDEDITGDFYVYKTDPTTNTLTQVTDSEELKKVLVVLSSQLV